MTWTWKEIRSLSELPSGTSVVKTHEYVWKLPGHCFLISIVSIRKQKMISETINFLFLISKIIYIPILLFIIISMLKFTNHSSPRRQK